MSLLLFVSIFIFPTISLAHPGRTDASGGHTCRTNCEKWGLEYGEYHYHNGGGSSSGSSSDTSTTKPESPVVTFKTITVTEAISFNTKKEDDPSLEEGKEKTVQEGKEGIKTITYKITYSDGKETDREKTVEEISQDPVDEIIAVGTKLAEEEKPVPVEEENKSSGGGLSSFVWLLILGGGGYWLYKKFKKKGRDNNE